MRKSTIVVISIIVLLAIYLFFKYFNSSVNSDNLIYKKGTDHLYNAYFINFSGDTISYDLTLTIPKDKGQLVLGTGKAKIPAEWKIKAENDTIQFSEAEVLDDSAMATLTAPSAGPFHLINGAAPLVFKSHIKKGETFASSKSTYKNGSWNSSTSTYTYKGKGSYTSPLRSGTAHKFIAIAISNDDTISQEYYFNADSGFILMKFRNTNGDLILIEKE